MPLPRLAIYDHHPSSQAGELLEYWQQLAESALPWCLAAAKGELVPLRTLPEIEVSLVSDEMIAQVHGEFLDDPSTTDVITFQHGEILVSLDTARRQAPSHGETYEREVLLYMIHGLLHLGGWDDRQEQERQEMHAVQDRILKVVA